MLPCSAPSEAVAQSHWLEITSACCQLCTMTTVDHPVPCVWLRGGLRWYSRGNYLHLYLTPTFPIDAPCGDPSNAMQLLYLQYITFR
jgi:hypothetical protein